MTTEKTYFVAIDQETGDAFGAGETVQAAIQDAEKFHPGLVYEIHPGTKKLHDVVHGYDVHSALTWLMFNGVYDVCEPF